MNRYASAVAAPGLPLLAAMLLAGAAPAQERALELSERRLAEARALAEQGKPEEAERAADRYREQLDRALTSAEQARAEGEDPDGEVMNDVSEATSRHQAVLEDVRRKVPEEARPGIERAMEASERGGTRAAKAREAASEERTDDGNLLEQGARAAGLALGEDALESRLEDYSSLECAEFMWRAKTGEFEEVRQAVQ